VLWILGIFYILPSLKIEAIARLIPIHLYLQKLSRYQQLRTHSLLKNHIIKFLLENRHNELGRNYCLLLENLTSIQQLKVKGPIADSMSDMVHTRVKVHRIDSEMSGLVERPWLQLMYCTIYLPCGCNFRWKRESPSGSEYWLVCCCWTPEIKFNESLSLSIIRLANYSVTTSLIYNW